MDAEGEKIEGVEIHPFTVKLDDPSGNSWIEFIGSMSDPKWSMKTYPRTREQNGSLGLDADAEDADTSVAIHAIEKPSEIQMEKIREGEVDEVEKERLANEEVFVFPGTCSSCHAPLDTLMKKVVIPYFKVRPRDSSSLSMMAEGGRRMCSSCLRIASGVDTGTTRSSPVGRSLKRGDG